MLQVRNILQNTYEGSKDKEENDIIDELAELTHNQAVQAQLAAQAAHGRHRLSKQKSVSPRKEGTLTLTP